MLLKSTFLAFKKKLSKLGGGGERGNLDKIQKNSNFFFHETVPYHDIGSVDVFGKKYLQLPRKFGFQELSYLELDHTHHLVPA